MNDAPLAAAPTADSDSDSDSGCGFSTAPVDIPLALYVHLPWCARKCPYCDFNSHAVRAPIPETEYVDALIRDLDFELQQGQARPLSSVFFGGGTPSLFGAAAIGRVLEHASRRLGFEPDIEIDNLPHATFNGKDAQLDKAIEHLKQKIQEDPRPVPPPPAYPDKSFKNNKKN